jgi:flagellar P-ring protein precursor FlgI
MCRLVTILLFLLSPLLLSSTVSGAGSRIKDLAMVAGARDNQLVGYGLVAGLAGDGDKNPVYTIQSIANMLQRFGITVPSATLSSKNVAAVMITADIPAFVRSGTRLDVTVSALGDAKTLQGGILLQTPLLGADGKIYAVAQGALAIGGFIGGTGGGGGATLQKNHPTVGQILGGGLVEKEIETIIVRNNHLELLLREPDFTSAARMALAINNVFTNSAQAIDSTAVRVRVPEGLGSFPVDFVARIEAIEVIPDIRARVVINERTGTIVATSQIRIATCAVSHGELTISIASTLEASQPNPFSQVGSTVVTPRTETKVTEPKGALIALPEMPTIEKVAAFITRDHEHHIVPDRTRPMDFEVYQVTSVVGHGVGSESEQPFLPFYTAYCKPVAEEQTAYFTTRREPRLVSSSQKRRGTRSSYIGTEVFLSLVDPADAPFRGDLRQLSVQTLCTNRDLVLQMPMGLGTSDFTLGIAAPVTSVRVVSGPSRPYSPLVDGAVSWRAISHLSLNYLSLVNTTPQEGAVALRELLTLYAPGASATANKQIEGVRRTWCFWSISNNVISSQHKLL